MSKVISFSISDRYLDKLRTLYPALTDNLAAKQFLTDGLESSLSSTLDDVLYERLDGQLKTIIETSLDDVLDERLDAVMGKLITSLSERLSRLEERLDDSLYGRLDDMELLLRMQQSASIASPDEQGEDAIGTLTSESGSSIEGEDAIGPVGMTAMDAAKYLKTKKVKVSYDSLHRWISREKIPDSPQGKDVRKHLILRDGLYYPIN